MNVRKKVLSLLERYEKDEGFANLLLTDDLIKEAAEQANFLTALFYGCVERKLALDYAIGVLGNRDVQSLSSTLRHILWIGLYQIYYMKLPSYAAVNETVALGKEKGQKALINAILRRALREEQPLPPADRVARHLSVRESIPLETVRRFLSLYGEEKTKALLACFNRVSPLTLCLATDKIVPKDYVALLAKRGIAAETTHFSKTGVRVLSPASPALLPGFADGWFFVQDEASQLQTAALGAKEGDLVIDVCACPGGKSFGAALSVHKKGLFYAFDVHESKLSLIQEGADRLGLAICCRKVDATLGDETLFAKADRVICDVPCSGLGVLGKKPDLRYRTPSKDLPPLQAAILERSACYLKPGGVLLYSTCTLLPEENEQQISAFLARHPEFSPVEFGEGELKSHDGVLTLLPFLHGTDGFFIAKLQKER